MLMVKSLWLPGAITIEVGTLLEALWVALSVTVTVTAEVPAVVGMPVISPVAGLMLKPAGNPNALQE